MNKITIYDRFKEAFWLKLCGLPLNFLALIGFGFWGFGNHWAWMYGVIFEIVYLLSLVGSPIVNKSLMDKEAKKKLKEWELRKKKILDKISPVGRKRFYQLETLGQSITSMTMNAKKDGLPVDMAKLKTVSQLLWLALKLLASREIMVQNIKGNSKDALEIKIANLKKSRDTETNEKLKAMFDSTLETMEKRLRTYDDVNVKIKEIDLNLLRIEEQLPLLRNVAALEVQNGKGSVTQQIDNAQSAIDETNEWMLSAKDLFSSLEDDLNETPPDDVFIGISEKL